MKLSHLVVATVITLTGSWALAGGASVTVYSADGLHDGQDSWYQTQFDAFSKATGIKVLYVEGGSGAIVERLAKERSNPQADVLVTLPPFIQRGVAQKLLQAFSPEGVEHIANAQPHYTPLVYNYLSFIYNAKLLAAPPASFAELLDKKFHHKLQYSTPGQAGDGTAVMLQAFHSFGSKDAGFKYLGQLQENNVGPSSSTGKLTALVNKGELLVANGDLQMNLAQMQSNPNVKVFWPAGPDGKRSTLSLPYYIGLVAGAPQSENGKKLINFLLSQPAQRAISSSSYGLPVRQDVQPNDAKYQQAQAAIKGLEIWQPDWDAVLKDLSSDIARWQQVTQ